MGCGQSSKAPVSSERLNEVHGTLASSLERASLDIGHVGVRGRYHKDRLVTDDYEVNESQILGAGYNGVVHRARAKSDGSPVAIKDFHYRHLDQTRMSELEHECEIFLSMDHPKVVHLVDVYQGPDKLSLVMECMEGGEVADRVLKNDMTYSATWAADSAYQMLLAINYLHEKSIVHRDIKLENFLFEKPDNDNLKLIDFGFSRKFDVDTRMKMNVGSLPYVAPEVLRKSYDHKCDMWSLGVAVFVLLAGYLPFSGTSTQAMMKNITTCRVDVKSSWEHVRKDNLAASDFVMSLLKINVAKRLSAKEALNHRFIREQSQRAAHHSVLAKGNVDPEMIMNLCMYSHASKFRRALMSAMAWSLSQEDRNELRDEFLAMDTGRSGTITLDEFKSAVAKRFRLTDTELREAFNSLADAGKEEVCYSDFLAATLSTKVNLHDDLVYATFRRFDKTGNGFIEAHELKQIFVDLDEDDIRLLIKEADIAGDGKISYNEFVEFARAGNGHIAELADKLIDREMETSASESTTLMQRKIEVIL